MDSRSSKGQCAVEPTKFIYTALYFIWGEQQHTHARLNVTNQMQGTNFKKGI